MEADPPAAPGSRPATIRAPARGAQASYSEQPGGVCLGNAGSSWGWSGPEDPKPAAGRLATRRAREPPARPALTRRGAWGGNAAPRPEGFPLPRVS